MALLNDALHLLGKMTDVQWCKRNQMTFKCVKFEVSFCTYLMVSSFAENCFLL